MYEVATRDDLPEIAPPAVAYVRNEGDYYWRFWDCWRKVDNSFPVNDDPNIPIDSLYALANDSTLTYKEMLKHHYAWRNAPLMEVTTKTGKIAFMGNKMYAIQDLIPSVEWMDQTFDQMGIPILQEGTPGIHLQDRKIRKSLIGFYDEETKTGAYHTEPIGFVICKGASKGATSIECSINPPSVATKVHTPCKQTVLLDVPEGATGPSTCVNGVEHSNVSWPYTNEMWLTGPWEYIDLTLNTCTQLGSPTSWPDAFTCELTFDDPIPMPIIAGDVGFLNPGDWYINPARPSISWVTIGDYGKTIGKTAITVRISTAGSENTLWAHQSGSTSIRMFEPWHMLPGGQRRNSGIRGLVDGDRVCFAKTELTDPNFPDRKRNLDRTLYRVYDVDSNPLGNPSKFRIAPGLAEPLLDQWELPFSVYSKGNLCYWLAFPQKGMTYRCMGWTDPHGDTGVPIFIKEVKGNTLELLSPLPADIPANTKMYMWSAVDNETMTYAYHDPYTYIYNKAFDRQVSAINPQVVAWNDYIWSEIRRYENMQAAAMEAAKRIWFTPPFYTNSLISELAGLPEGETFYDIFQELSSKLITLTKPKHEVSESNRDLEYLSLLNYRSML